MEEIAASRKKQRAQDEVSDEARMQEKFMRDIELAKQNLEQQMREEFQAKYGRAPTSTTAPSSPDSLLDARTLRLGA